MNHPHSHFPFRICWRRSLLPLAGLLLLSAESMWAEESSPIPRAWPSARYEQLMQQSPFALATPVAPAAEAQAGFASNWFVSGIGRLDGEEFVTIKARDLSTQFSLYGHETNGQNGVALASIEWSDKIGKSTVVITKGTETAKLEFNEAEIRGPALVTTTAAPGQAAGTKPGQPATAAGRPPMTALPQMNPGIAPPQRSGNPSAITQSNPFPSPGQTPAGTNPLQGQDRRRIRIINAPAH